jgi:hypothetical protein
MPLQVFLELQHNLTAQEMRDSLSALKRSREFRLDYEHVAPEVIHRWEVRGARLGDAIIAAQLELAGVAFLVPENRHFLLEIPDLPFEVLSAAEALDDISRAN